MLWQVSQTAFPAGSPWKKEQFESDIALEHSHYFYEKNGSQVVAFLGIHQVCDEIEITNVATHQAYHQQGLASALMKKLLAHAKAAQVGQIFLEVRASNHIAQQFYHKFGFEKLAVRKQYYHDPVEDALIMRLKVGNLDV